MNRSSHVKRIAPRPQSRSDQGTLEPVGDTCEVDVVHLDAVVEARAGLPDDVELGRMAELLALLSSPTRLKMLLALRPKDRRTRRELCVCDLATVTGASKSLTSHQLRLLRAAGLVSVRRSGRLAYYRLADGAAAKLLRDALEASFASR